MFCVDRGGTVWLSGEMVEVGREWLLTGWEPEKDLEGDGNVLSV